MILLFGNVSTATGTSSSSASGRGQPSSTMMTDPEMEDDTLTETMQVLVGALRKLRNQELKD